MKQVLIAIDQLVNVLCFWLPGGGWADESLSSRAWRIRDTHPRLRKAIDTLFFWDSNHCEASFESERKRLQSPPELRS